MIAVHRIRPFRAGYHDLKELVRIQRLVGISRNGNGDLSTPLWRPFCLLTRYFMRRDDNRRINIILHDLTCHDPNCPSAQEVWRRESKCRRRNGKESVSQQTSQAVLAQNRSTLYEDVESSS